MMSMPQTLDELMKDQLRKATELDIATNFLIDRATVKEALIELMNDVDSINLGICSMKKDLDQMKKQNDMCKKLTSCYNLLKAKIRYLESNVPAALIQDIQKPNNQIVEQDTQPQSKIEIKVNGTSGKKVNCNKTAEFDLTKEALDTTEFYPQIQDCRKILFKEDNDDAYVIKPLTQAEFAKIPKYMIGRQSITSVNDFISTINNVLKAKYSLLALGKIGARKKGELELYLQFKKEQTDVYPNKGSEKKYFFTADDYCRETKLKLDKAKLNMLTVLRHSKRILELRNGKAVRYEIITSN